MADEDDQIASPTLAELYYKQDDIGKAVRVLKEVLARNPENQGVRSRLREMELEFLKVMDAGNKNQIIRKLNKVLMLVRKERLG
jgi:ribosomal protein S20